MRSGEETLIDLELRPGFEKTLRIHAGGDVGTPILLELVARDASGASVLQDWCETRAPTLDYVLVLLPGSYTVDVSTRSGHRGTASFTVDERSTRADVLEVEIH